MKPHPVPTLTQYLHQLPHEQAREGFAKRCKTSLGYLRLIGYGHKLASEGLAIRVERESDRSVTCEVLRPDVDWAFIRSAKKARTA